MGKHLIAGVVAASSLFSGLAAADHTDSRWYISPMATYILEDEERGADNEDEEGGYGLRLSLGRAISDHVNFEFNAFAAEIDTESGVKEDNEQYGVGIDLLFIPKRGGIQPYGLLGIGGMRDFIDDNGVEEDDTFFFGTVGAGVLWQLTDNGTSLRTEARFRTVLNDEAEPASQSNGGENEYQDWEFGLGLNVPFGSTVKDADGDGVVNGADACPNTPAGQAVNSRGCPPDSDGDGVADSVDLCPATPRGTIVNATGCAGDGDADGVADNADACPNTPAGALVDVKGCSIDDDRDGVVNSADRCPNTPAGTQVDYNGCELKDVLVLEGVNFKLNSSELMSSSRSILNKATGTLAQYPNIVVEVAGHTDSTGKNSYNQWLSQKRAETVMKYLSNRGISSSRMTARGYGETSPVASNGDRAGRAKNRRVEFRILSR